MGYELYLVCAACGLVGADLGLRLARVSLGGHAERARAFYAKRWAQMAAEADLAAGELARRAR